MLKNILKHFIRGGVQCRRGPFFERLENRVLLSATLDVEKEIIATSETETTGTDLVIGEIVTYEITASLPEGVTGTVTLTDFLPDNIEFMSGTLSVTPNGPITTDYVDEVSSVSYAGNVLTINFGTVINVFDSDPTNDFIVISFNALVVNDFVNQNGDTMTNEVILSDGTNSVTDSVDANIVEPELDVIKDVSGDDTGIEVGDVVDYTIEVSHGTGSTASAFDLDLQDVLPDALEGVSITSAWIIEDGSTAVDVSSSFMIDANGDLVTIGDVDLFISGPGGGSQRLLIMLSGTVARGTAPSSIVTNTANLTWSSINGVSANERDGSGGVNDYTATDPAIFTLADPRPPVEPPSPPEVTDDPVFSFDSVRNEAVETELVLDYDIPDLDYVLPGLPVAPLYTGTALPGSTLVVSLMDVNGDMLAANSVVVGPDGNWLVSFPTAYLEDYPYGIEVQHELLFSSPIGDSKLDELSLQYSPATNIISLFKYSLNTEWVYHQTTSRSLELMHNFVSQPII